MATTTAATISVAEAGRRIGCSRYTLYRLIATDRFYPAVRLGERIMVSVDLLDQFLRTGGQRVASWDMTDPFTASQVKKFGLDGSLDQP